MIVGIVCPNCGEYITEKYQESRNFICKKCKLILEPPDGMRQYTEVTPLSADSKITRGKNRPLPYQRHKSEV